MRIGGEFISEVMVFSDCADLHLFTGSDLQGAGSVSLEWTRLITADGNVAVTTNPMVCQATAERIHEVEYVQARMSS